MSERSYEVKLKARIRKMFPGCVIFKNDPSYMQGVPDLLILFMDKWAMLEVKLASDSRKRPNQEFFIKKFNKMSFASFINPDNEEAVLRALQSAFGIKRKARVS